MATTHQLARLIDGVKHANGWSDPDLVRNAEEMRHVLSKSNISRYRKPLVSIKGEIIEALAAGLRVSPDQVAIAAIESMGIALPSYDTPTPEQVIRLDVGLSTKDKNSLLALLRQLRRDAAAEQGTPQESDQGEKTGPSLNQAKRSRGERLTAHTETLKAMRENRRLNDPDDTHQERG